MCKVDKQIDQIVRVTASDKPSVPRIKINSEIKVLIANDDPFLLQGYLEQLSAYFQVETAENGLQAMQIVSSLPRDYF